MLSETTMLRSCHRGHLVETEFHREGTCHHKVNTTKEHGNYEDLDRTEKHCVDLGSSTKHSYDEGCSMTGRQASPKT